MRVLKKFNKNRATYLNREGGGFGGEQLVSLVTLTAFLHFIPR
jgi:hypothetical protein